jgi:hypothetical protein
MLPPNEYDQPLPRLAAKFTGDRPLKTTHKWKKGIPTRENINTIRRDSCRKCQCIRVVTILPGHDWIDHYEINGITTTNAPICN